MTVEDTLARRDSPKPESDDNILPLPATSDPLSWNHHGRDGYGFRASGVSTPVTTMPQPANTASPLPDPNGLGWPGEMKIVAVSSAVIHIFCGTAKSTVSRLNASAAEKATRELKLTSAVRTILECIGEDPDREGLLRTPERYAQALMWMTRGYEERLTGAMGSVITSHINSEII